MKKRTKKILSKIGVGVIAILTTSFSLFNKKEKEKTTPTINKKEVSDDDLFI